MRGREEFLASAITSAGGSFGGGAHGSGHGVSHGGSGSHSGGHSSGDRDRSSMGIFAGRAPVSLNCLCFTMESLCRKDFGVVLKCYPY